MKKNGFSILEIIFVIVILGILASVAIPRFAITTDEAYIARAKSTINNIRSAIITIRSEGILIGNTSFLSKLDNLASTTSNDNDNLFDTDGTREILQNPILSSTNNGGWSKTNTNEYTFFLNNNQTIFKYNPSTGTFNCDKNELCLKLIK